MTVRRGPCTRCPAGPPCFRGGGKAPGSCRCCRRTETGPGPVRDTEEELAGRGRDHLQPGCREGLKGGLRPGRSKKSRRKGEGTRDCRGSVVLVEQWPDSGALRFSLKKGVSLTWRVESRGLGTGLWKCVRGSTDPVWHQGPLWHGREGRNESHVCVVPSRPEDAPQKARAAAAPSAREGGSRGLRPLNEGSTAMDCEGPRASSRRAAAPSECVVPGAGTGSSVLNRVSG